MRNKLVVFGLAMSVAGLSAQVCCTPQEAKSADAIVVDLTDAACSAVEATLANPVVDVACTLGEAVEAAVQPAIAAATAVDAAPLPVAKAVTLKIPQAQVKSFLAAHQGKKKPLPDAGHG